ncbi:MAG TPA: hypothetical protein VN604_02760, partial [Nitrospirota bacterium]|nr:hypothetical protein [Nitrospirota bacterium]
MVTEIVYRRLRGLFCLLAAVFCLSATGAWGAAATIAVRGSVGGGVDTIVAVPVVRGTLDGTNMLQSVAVPVKAGTFTVNVAKDKDWLFVLENSTITGPGRVVGQIAFQTGETGNTLLLLPVSSAAVTKINIGQVVLTNGEWLAGIPLSAASFAMTPAQLSMLARYDDRFASVKNLVLNTSGSTGVSYSLRPDFSWYGNYAELTRSYSQPWNY